MIRQDKRLGEATRYGTHVHVWYLSSDTLSFVFIDTVYMYSGSFSTSYIEVLIQQQKNDDGEDKKEEIELHFEWMLHSLSLYLSLAKLL